MSDYSRTCANCDYFNLSSMDSDGKCYCNKHDERKYPDHYCDCFYNAYRSSDSIKDTIDDSNYKRGPVHWGFHIATAIFDILGLKTNDVFYNITNLRILAMEGDPKYEELLNRYDVLGRRIGDNLKLDNVRENGEEFSKAEIMCMKLYKLFLVPVSELVSKKEYEKAIIKYNKMFELLIEIYSKENKQVSLCGRQYKKMDYGLY